MGVPWTDLQDCSVSKQGFASCRLQFWPLPVATEAGLRTLTMAFNDLKLRPGAGSPPCSSTARTASQRFRASANVISGYDPSASRFSLPRLQYFSRQSLEPLGKTSIYRPLPAAFLNDFVPGLAALVSGSLCGIGGMTSPQNAPGGRNAPSHAPKRDELRRHAKIHRATLCDEN